MPELESWEHTERKAGLAGHEESRGRVEEMVGTEAMERQAVGPLVGACWNLQLLYPLRKMSVT